MEPQLSTSKAQNEYDNFLDPTAPKNMSELKLMNNSLEDFDRKEAVEKFAVSNAETLMCAAAERLRQLAFHEGEECVVDIDGQSVCKVAVSIDGT